MDAGLWFEISMLETQTNFSSDKIVIYRCAKCSDLCL